ncbi:MAG: hypothetical protein ABSA78_22795 [Candidatus Sulfotelmatobacter sp.]
MGEDDYKKALEAAEKELADLEVKAEVVTQRRAQLQQTIGALKTLMNISEQEERTITDTIRIVLKATNDYIVPADVLKQVLAMGVQFSSKNAIASVVTILGRLHKDGELQRDMLGRYRWNRPSANALADRVYGVTPATEEKAREAMARKPGHAPIPPASMRKRFEKI